MSITLQCSCGKTLEVDDIHRGKKAKCPACGNVMLVEGTSDAGHETAVQTEQPKPRFAAGEPATRTSAERPAAAKRSMLPWLAVGGCSILALLTCVITGGGIGIWYFALRGPESDLAFVHADVAGFVSIRVADIAKSRAVEGPRGLHPAQKKELDKKVADVKGKLGVTLHDIERLTIIFRTIDARRDGPPDLAVVVRANKPFDKKKILAFLAADKNEKKHNGATYHVADDGGRGGPTALCFVSDRILLFAPSEAGLKDFLTQSARPATHPAVANGVKLASAGKHQLVVALKWSAALTGELPKLEGDVASLRDMTGITIAGTLDQQMALEAIGAFASADAAGRAKSDLDRFRRDTIQELQNMQRHDDDPERIFLKLFEAATIEQQGAELVVKSRADADLNPFAGEILRGLDFRSPGQVQSVNNLKQIGLALHGFHDANKSFPNHALLRPDTGQPLLSWRVTILPYVDEGPLYNEIRHDEPWDSPHNRQFWDKMPKVYLLPGAKPGPLTHYQVFHGDESAFPKSRRGLPNFAKGLGDTRVANITDGMSNTIFVVEAAEAVNWMKPDDIPFQLGQKDLINRVGNHWGDGAFHACMGDGAVRRVRRTLTAQTLEALVTRAGGEPFDDRDWEP